MLRPVTALRSLVFAVFAVSACVSSREHARPNIPSCPGFNLKLEPINVNSTGGPPIALSQNGQTRITFSPGAVSNPTTFNVNAVTEDGETKAGVGFTPGTGVFPQPVLLRISYNGCPEILANQNGPLHIVFKNGNGNWESIGGGKDTTQHYVEAYVQHFTDFAIAL
jgi:hypothetical protein